jgi:hypothetical protein
MAKSSPFPRTLWWYTAVIFLAAAAIGGVFVRRDGAPDLAAVALFGVLLVFARNRDVSLPGGVTIAATTMILMAAVVVFAADGAPAGAVFVGMLAGLYLPSFTRASWGWIPFNAGAQGLAASACALAYTTAVDHISASFPAGLVPLAAAIVAFLCVEQCVLLASYIVELKRVPGELVGGLARYVIELLPFAAVGYATGRLYVSLGPAVLVLIIVPILIAREMFASYMRVKESHEGTVGMLIRALEQKDHYTAGHAERVANYARYMGEELNFMPARLERLRFAALMHDIGKLVVPNQILNKPGRLTSEEFARVRLHEKVGVQMLSHIDFLAPIAPTTHGDAMRFDPDDVDHPIEPYIVMIADAYDAMTSTRAYRRALRQEVAFTELRDKAGIQFHPDCVEALIGAIERRGEKHGAGYEPHTEFIDAPETGLGSAGLGDLAESESSRSA